MVVGLVAVGCVVAAAVASSSGLGRSAGWSPLFSASGVGAGVGPCVFGCGLVLLPSLALFVGLHLDLGLCCAWSGKNVLMYFWEGQTPSNAFNQFMLLCRIFERFR